MSDQHSVLSSNIGFTAPNGPFIVTGDIHIKSADGSVVEQPRASLCRCGASARKPFCDGTHKTCGYVEPGEATAAAAVGEPGAAGPLIVETVPSGPLHLSGPLSIQNAAKETIANVQETWLCRCGHSANAPYCDGSHKTCGFVAD